jgi:hypothetical protein
MKNTYSFSKYLLVLFSVVILIACKPDDGKNGKNGNDGADGSGLTVSMASVSDCPSGGFIIFQDGVSQGFFCSGTDGTDGTDLTVSVASITDCPNGGFEVFQDSVSQGFICSGTDGTNLTVSAASVTDCPNGGFEVFQDGVSKGFICSGSDGGSGSSVLYGGATVVPEPNGMTLTGDYEYNRCDAFGVASFRTLTIVFLDNGSYGYHAEEAILFDDACDSYTYDVVSANPMFSISTKQFNDTTSSYIIYARASVDGDLCYLNDTYVNKINNDGDPYSDAENYTMGQKANGDLWNCTYSIPASFNSLAARKVSP